MHRLSLRFDENLLVLSQDIVDLQGEYFCCCFESCLIYSCYVLPLFDLHGSLGIIKSQVTDMLYKPVMGKVAPHATSKWLRSFSD